MNLPTKFELFLKENSRVSGKTLRNYRADFYHFVGWATLHLKQQGISVTNPGELLPHFTGSLVTSYKNHHLETGTPESTANRRLSTLRNLGKFLLAEGLIDQNPMELVTNVKPDLGWEKQIEIIIEDFKKHLEEKGVSSITCKNYISDIRHFLNWSYLQNG